MKSQYYGAIGQIVNTALVRVLEDVLALPDIPELESHRLAELCRVLNALEGLFVDDPNEVLRLMNILEPYTDCRLLALICGRLRPLVAQILVSF